MRERITQKENRVNKNLGAKAIEVSSIDYGKNKDKAISIGRDELGCRKFIIYALAGFLALSSSLALSSKGVFAKMVLKDPPKYYSNVLTDFTISKIIPAQNYIEGTFEQLPDKITHAFYRLHVGFGVDPSDYELYSSIYSDIPGATTIHNQFATRLGVWSQGKTLEITKTFRTNGGDLSTNTTGRMYYMATFSDGDIQISRVDYSRCTHSSVFKSGEATECRAEKIGDNKIQYQPYTSDGTRVEIPEAEDIELTALTERFVYESGDWPAEYIWVDDENPSDDNSDESGNNPSDNNPSESGNEDSDNNNGGGNNPGSDAGTDYSSEPSNNGDNQNNDSSETSQSDNQGTITSADTETTTTLAMFTDATSDISSKSTSEGILGTDTVTVEIKVADSNDSNNTNSTNDSPAISTNPTNSASKSEDNVGVPELGKEFGNKNWWVAPLLMLLGAVAAIVAWWFLFFGKKKSNKEERSKE